MDKEKAEKKKTPGKCKTISAKNAAKFKRFLLSKTNTSTEALEVEQETPCPERTESSPTPVATPEGELKQQISAPCHFQSLAENELPPFRKPTNEVRPVLLVEHYPLVSEDDVVDMVAYNEAEPKGGLQKYLEPYLLSKKIVEKYEYIERDFLVTFIAEAIDYAAQRDFSAYKVSMLLTVYLTAHKYTKWYYWSSPVAIWNYFQELMVRLTIEDSPDAQCVFEPDECYDIITHFHTTYISNLPLIHILTFGSQRLRLNWLIKTKPN